MNDRPITVRQRRILQVIRDTTRERGYPPSMQEIADAAGLSSTSAVAYQIAALQRMGYLRKVPGKPRAIEVVEPREKQDGVTGLPPKWHGEDYAERRLAEIREHGFTRDMTIPPGDDIDWLLDHIDWLQKQLQQERGEV